MTIPTRLRNGKCLKTYFYFVVSVLNEDDLEQEDEGGSGFWTGLVLGGILF